MLARQLYEALLEASDAHLREVAESETGRMPTPPLSYYDRFGGVGPRSRLESSAGAAGAE
jgi:hypothetical protein